MQTSYYDYGKWTLSLDGLLRIDELREKLGKKGKFEDPWRYARWAILYYLENEGSARFGDILQSLNYYYNLGSVIDMELVFESLVRDGSIIREKSSDSEMLSKG